MRARNRELLALVPASLLVTAGFTAIFIQRHDLLSNVSLTYGLLFLGLCGSRCPTRTRTCSRSSRCLRASAW